MSQYIRTPFGAAATFDTFADFPPNANQGGLAIALDTNALYFFDPDTSAWVIIGGAGAPISIGALNGQPKNANALTIAANTLYTQTADGTYPGMVSTGVQSFAGNKTFIGTIGASNLSGTNTGDVTLGTANGLSLLGQALSLGLSSTSTTGALSSTDWNTFNSKFNLPSLTSGSVLFSNGTTIAQNNADFFWDDTNKNLKINASLFQTNYIDPFSRPTIWGNATDQTLELGSWQSDGMPTNVNSEGQIVYGVSMLGTPIAAGVGGYARVKANRFGLFTVEPSLPAFAGGQYYFRADNTEIYLRNDAGNKSFSAQRSSGNIVGGALSLSGAITQAQIATPSNPSAGSDKLYFKSDDKLYGLNSSGVEVLIGPSAGVATGNLTDVGTDGITITGGTGAVVGSGTTISQHVADSTHNGYLSSTDWSTFNSKQAALTIGALDSQAANADGLALSGSTLSTQSADATHPGMVNTTTQSFAGNKTFTGTIGASNLSGTNTGDVTLAAVGAVPSANGASLSGQVLTLQPFDSTHPGVVTASGGGTTNFLRADGTWAAPSGGGSSAITNLAPNGALDYWQAGTSVTVANGVSTYQADQYYVKNSLGTNGVITFSQTTGAVTGSVFGASVKITTAPTAAQANGTEIYYIFDKAATASLLGQSISAAVQVKAQGNVNQVGLQFFYATSETKPTTTLGAETTTSVSSGSFTNCKVENISVGTTPTTSGVVALRVRITTVSSGNTYDLNNGFIIEQLMINIGATAGTFTRFGGPSEELHELQRYYEKSYDIATAPGTASTTSGAILSVNVVATAAGISGHVFFKTNKRTTPTITIYNPNSGATGTGRTTVPSDVTVNTPGTGPDAVATAGEFGFPYAWGSGGLASGNYGSIHFVADARI